MRLCFSNGGLRFTLVLLRFSAHSFSSCNRRWRMRAIATFHHRRLPPTLMRCACSHLTQPLCAIARWVRLCFSSGGLCFALVLLLFSAHSFSSCNLRWRMRAIATFHHRRPPPTLMRYACSQLTQPLCAIARWVRLCFSSGGLCFALVLLVFRAHSFSSCNLRRRMRAIATFHHRRLPPALVRHACSQLTQPRCAIAQ